MNKFVATALVATTLAATGCGTIFNKPTIQAQAMEGVTIDGQSGYVTLDQGTPHTVQYANGGVCVIPSGISAGYLILDIFVTGLVGVVVDAITGDWTVLKGGCPGVLVMD